MPVQFLFKSTLRDSPFHKLKASAKIKGFLSAPETKIQAGSNTTWSNKIEKSWVNFTNCPVEANDWRFKVINSNSEKKHLIQLYSESFKNWNWVVFLNGRLIGTTPKNSEGVYSIFTEIKSK